MQSFHAPRQAGRLTRFIKVNSHVGITGNESADQLAVKAATVIEIAALEVKALKARISMHSAAILNGTFEVVQDVKSAECYQRSRKTHRSDRQFQQDTICPTLGRT